MLKVSYGNRLWCAYAWVGRVTRYKPTIVKGFKAIHLALSGAVVRLILQLDLLGFLDLLNFIFIHPSLQ